MILLNGKETAAAVKKEIAAKVQEMVATGERPPHLVAVLVGENGASKTYVANKEKACAEVGFKSTLLTFPDTVSEQELLSEIDRLNRDDDVDGFIIQLPLPKHIDENKVINAVSPMKDVDGFAAWLWVRMPFFQPRPMAYSCCWSITALRRPVSIA